MLVRYARLAGVSSVVGGLLAVVVAIPPPWYGLEPTDAYVFEAAPLSPLWVERVLFPALSVVAIVGLLVGTVGVVRRDWSVAGRARRWGGATSIVGLAGLTVAVPIIRYVSLGDIGASTLAILGGIALGVVCSLLLAFGLLLLGFGYSRTDRAVLGYAMVGVVVGVPLLGYLGPSPIESLLAALPIGLCWSLLGQDLLRRAEPRSTAERGRST